MQKIIVPIFLSLLGSLFVPSALGQPQVKRAQFSPFALILLATSENASQKRGINASFPVGVGMTKFMISHESITLNGQDKSGQPWIVKLDNQHIGFGYYLYAGDLDQNEYVDVILVTYTGANGFLPMAILTILSFDAQGRPCLWQDGQNVLVENAGIAQLIDLDQDGKAELITEYYDHWDSKSKWDGYYIANIYKIENACWGQLKQYAGINLPVYTHFSSKGRAEWLLRPSEKLPPSRHPFAPDLSNTEPVSDGKTESKSLVKKDGAEAELFRTNDDSIDRCYLKDFILVEDSKSERTISILSVSDEAKLKPLLAQAKIKLYGNCVLGKLSPRLIWITK